MDVPNPSVVPSLSPGELLSTKTRSVHYGTFPELWTWMDYVFADYLLGLNGTYITALVVLRSAGLLRSRGLLPTQGHGEGIADLGEEVGYMARANGDKKQKPVSGPFSPAWI